LALGFSQKTILRKLFFVHCVLTRNLTGLEDLSGFNPDNKVEGGRRVAGSTKVFLEDKVFLLRKAKTLFFSSTVGEYAALNPIPFFSRVLLIHPQTPFYPMKPDRSPRPVRF
jgi:hypothetical protein